MRKKILSTLILSVVILASITGCSSSSKYIKETLNTNLDISGIKFDMTVAEVESLLGDNYEVSPCVYGYEHEYSDLNLVVGFDKKDKVRKIIVKSGTFSVFGIADGTDKDSAIETLKSNSFTEKSPGEYACENVAIKFLTGSSSEINGVSVERVEE